MDMQTYVLLILFCAHTMAAINICNWNMRSLGSASHYLTTLAEGNDIVVASEHRLFRHQLYKLNDMLPRYHVHAKSSDDLEDFNSATKRGHCSLLVAWRESLSSQVRVISVDSDRICAIQIANVSNFKKRNLYVIGVYLPHQQCQISNFQHHLNKLESLVQQCHHDGEVLIIGDTNCYFGLEAGLRFHGQTTKHARQLLKIVDRNNLYIVDSSAKCTGPTYTFSVEGVGESYIDHVIASLPVLPHVVSCQVHEDTICNTSDHLSISVNIDIGNLPPCGIRAKPSRVNWSKLSQECIQDKYTVQLNIYLTESFPHINDSSVMNADEVSDVILAITKAMNHISEPLKTKFNKSVKPYWSSRLSFLNKHEKSLWHQWKAAGQPRDGSNIYIAYKEAKKLFRSEQIKAQQKYEMQQMEDLIQSSEVDHNYVWFLVNKSRKGGKQRITPIKLDNDTIISDPDEILESWRAYFQDLYTPKDNSQYDSTFKQSIQNEVIHMVDKSFNHGNKSLEKPFVSSEVVNIIQGLKNKKAPGFDEITSEHIKYGGKKLMSIMTSIYNSITYHETVPAHLKKGVIIPIPKGAKDASIKNNNRGITLIPVIGKIYEKLLLARHVNWADRKDKLDDLQGVAQPRASSTHTAWLLRETIAANTEKASSVYVALLDTSKAFDTVWIDGLFYKLLKSNMDGKLWRLLRNFYSDFRCCIKVGGVMSDWFEAGQGVHQGAPWSMYLYASMINGLLIKLKESGLGAKIGTIQTGNPTYADDIGIISIHKPLLQKLLKIAYDFSCQWRFEFNASKSEVIIFGTDLCPSLKLKLGDKEIVTKDGGSHMGVPLTNVAKFESEYIQDRIDSAQRSFFSVQGLGNTYTPVTPIVASKLYWNICVPKLTHGLEIACLSETSKKNIESSHGRIAKAIQGLPPQTSNSACLAPLGWTTMESYMHRLQLLFLWRILLMSTQCVYKQVAIERLCYYLYESTDNSKSTGPLWDILQTFRKYQLIPLLIEGFTTGIYIPIG